MVIMEIKAVLPLSLADFRILNKIVGENTQPDSDQLKELSILGLSHVLLLSKRSCLVLLGP